MISETTLPQTIGVMICTYHRPEALAACLGALALQERLPDEVMIVTRATDAQTRGYLSVRPVDGLTLRVVTVLLPGLMHARNAGFDACRTDLIAITDDDTTPRPDWISRILAHFVADPRLGGLGGRDRCYDGNSFDDRQFEPVGRISWYGRAVGNHHLGFGRAREVDNLKGANMSYRALAILSVRVDSRLRGSGATPSEDLFFSLAVRRAGWRLLYDPQVLVHHYPQQREDERYYVGVGPIRNAEEYRNVAYNDVVCFWNEFSLWRHVVYFFWSLAIGTRVLPGLVQAIRFTPALGLNAWHRWLLVQQGKLGAYRDLIFSRHGRIPPPEILSNDGIPSEVKLMRPQLGIGE